MTDANDPRGDRPSRPERDDRPAGDDSPTVDFGTSRVDGPPSSDSYPSDSHPADTPADGSAADGAPRYPAVDPADDDVTREGDVTRDGAVTRDDAADAPSAAENHSDFEENLAARVEGDEHVDDRRAAGSVDTAGTADTAFSDGPREPAVAPEDSAVTHQATSTREGAATHDDAVAPEGTDTHDDAVASGAAAAPTAAWAASTEPRRPLHDDEALRAAEAHTAATPEPGSRGDDSPTVAAPVTDTEPPAGSPARPWAHDAPTVVAPAAAEPGLRPAPVVDAVDPVEARRDLLAEQKEEFGGIRFGAGLLGWFTATGVGFVAISIVLAVLGVYVSVSARSGEERLRFAGDNAEVLASVIGIAVLVIVFVGYFVGGYAASRIARFSGFKQGLATWLWGLVISIVVAVVGAIAGTQGRDMRAPDGVVPSYGTGLDSSLVLIVFVALLVVLSFGGAVLGGLLGQRYHRKVDRFVAEPI
ncbi:TIGR04086 family membrane protein [Frigoribacterium sp. 2-23]|uniref:TIGR04086 family membrane protein n=1 Tax=Frigoribacterium sp. 2-23 TaxID=3415006 RepID=UPI003C6F5E85